MGTPKNNQTEEQRFNQLKEIAVNLGVDFSPKIGFETLEKRIKDAKIEKKQLSSEKPKKLSNKQVMTMKAKSLSKVKIMNMDKDNSGATTVFTGVHNMQLDLARVVPLNMEIALEEVLIQDIENRMMLIPTPVLDKFGGKTGNFKMIEAPMYAVSRLK